MKKKAIVKKELTWWDKDPDREKALNLLFTGMSKRRVAQTLSRHMETVVAWSRHDEFRQRLSELLGNHVEETRIRRLKQTTHFADAAAAQLERAHRKLVQDPEDRGASARAAAWADQFRKWRAEERVDFGDDVKRSEVSVVGNLGVNHKTSHEISVKAFLMTRLEQGVIDVTGVEGTDVGTVFSSVLQQALLDAPEAMDVMDEEDRALEEGKKK